MCNFPSNFIFKLICRNGQFKFLCTLPFKFKIYAKLETKTLNLYFKTDAFEDISFMDIQIFQKIKVTEYSNFCAYFNSNFKFTANCRQILFFIQLFTLLMNISTGSSIVTGTT